LLAETGSAEKLAIALYEVAKARAAGSTSSVVGGATADTPTPISEDLKAREANLKELTAKIQKKINANNEVKKLAPAPTPLTAAQVSGMRYAAQAAAQYAAKTPVKRSMGGLIPKYMAAGGFARGTDTIPAMLTPGEFVMSKYAVDKYGVENMKAINSGSSVGDSVYNYNLNLNVKSDANPDDIARAVMVQIKSVDAQRIRGARF